MKRNLLTFGWMAVVAAGCATTELEIGNIAPSRDSFSIFANPVETKTANDGLNTVWTDSDELNVFYAPAGTDTYSDNISFTTSQEDAAYGIFTGAIEGRDLTLSYDWYVLYPYSDHIQTPANAKEGYSYIGCRSDRAQEQNGNDSKAHLCGSNLPLWGKATGVAGTDTPNIAMKQVASVVAIRVTNGSTDPLMVNSVAFTAPESIVGTYFIDFSGDAPVLTEASYVASTANLTVSNPSAIAAGATATFYLAVKPFTAHSGDDLVIQVNDYAKTLTLGKDVTFAAGAIKPIGFNYDKAPDAAADYALYTGTMTEGDYIIYYDGKAMNTTVANNRLQYVEVTPVSDEITTSNKAIVWHIAPSGEYWTIYNAAESKYAAATGTKNQAGLIDDPADDKALWTVTRQSDGTFEFVNKSNAAAGINSTLRNNGTYGFAAYATSTGGPLSLFKEDTPDTRLDAGMSWSATSASATITDTGISFQAPTLTPGQATGVTYHSTNEAVATVSAAGEVVPVAAGTTTIQAIFAGDADYLPATAEYTLTVTDERIPVSTTYVLFTGTLVEGDYIIYYDGKAMNTTVASNRLQYVEVTPVSDEIETTNTAIVWHIAPSGEYWTLYNAAESKYAAATGTKNQAGLIDDPADDKALWTVTRQSDGTFEFVNKSNAAANINSTLRNNGTYGFAAYATSTGGPLSLYKKGTPDTRLDAGMSWSATSASATITDTGISFQAPTLTPGQATGVTYHSTNEAVATVSAAGEVVPVAAGTTTIQAIFAGDTDYKPATAEYTLTVTDERTVATYAFETVAQLNALATSTSVTKNGKLTDAVVSFVPGTGDAIIKDATGSVLLHKSEGHGLLQGQTFTGEVSVKVQLYNGCSEITDIDATFTGSETVVEPAVATLSDLSGNLTAWQNAYVKVEDLTVTAVSGTNISVTDGTNNYIVYASAGNPTCVVSDKITVVGTVGHHGSDDQVKAWKADAITVTYHQIASHTVTLVQPEGDAANAGCYISASAGGTATLPDVSSLNEGVTVTISAEEDGDFSFVSWSVSGATVSDAGAATTTFTVGTSDVTVKANFKDNNSTSLTDVLEPGAFGNPSSYSDWSGKTGTSGAVYAGNSTGGNTYFQLRTTNSNSGIVTTASGGYATKVTVTWADNTDPARILQVYGKNSAYAAATDLYDSSKQGTLLGEIAKSSSQSLTIVGDFEYIGLRSSYGALYLSEIQIEWSTVASGVTPPAPTYAVSWSAPTQAGCLIAATVGGAAISSGDAFEEGTVVSIQATVGDGFTFGGWNVSGATVADATATTTTFTVGTAAVTVGASFPSAGGGNIPDPETITFANLGLENSVQYSDPFNGGHFTIQFGGGTNDGKYYTTGSGIRTYGNGTITIASSHTISEILFSWDGSNAPTADNASPAGYNTTTKKWTGSANQVVLTRPSGSGHWRLQAVTVTFAD